jgi:ABC-type transporter Mla MlaB component
MLKITARIDASKTILELEGQLAGPWVPELENLWRKAVNSAQSVTIMVCGVTFMDDNGKALLTEMHRHGAELLAEGCMNKAIVQQITEGGRQ